MAGKKIGYETDFRKLTDVELEDAYFKHISPGSFSVMIAGLAAGELTERGYDIVEDEDENERFVKKDKARKVA